MAALPIEIQDVSRVLSQLVMPSPRRPTIGCPASTHQQHPSTLKHLAPIEMATQSIHLHQPYHQLQVLGPQSGATNGYSKGQHHGSVSIAVAGPGTVPDSGASLVVPGKPPSLANVGGWLIPCGYTVCGLGMGLCNLIAPSHTPECAQILGPIWTLSLGLHVASELDPVWFWWGILCILLLPFVILVRDFLFAAFYLLAFAGFSSGRFWQFFQGPSFILLCICWAGLLASLGLSLASDHPSAQISAAGFFSLTAGIISSTRISRLFGRILA
jgi:hypothetical protein